MDATHEILPPAISDFRLPPGLAMPGNVVMTEEEAARFCRESVSRFRGYRFAGTGPAFVLSPNGGCAPVYLCWDVLAWLVSRRHAIMPKTRLRGRRRVEAGAAAA
ncbi:hypothetical protein ASG32_27245 [Methylobacterium sp. Leaf361]|uniref:hypothetical protein n=1 Tax=Methylobacterium sp. Leaf361 TaxID=1736352 RepID=UPI0006F6F6CF|nr:hypothetical protein [Methylobacterium sp. Leaf361]KQS75462.1 hypothetical protein ASG32_27245 [Methylobacterium sp. Leaf361]